MISNAKIAILGAAKSGISAAKLALEMGYQVVLSDIDKSKKIDIEANSCLTIELGEHSLMRLGNVIVPNSSYGEIIEAVVMPALEEIYQDRLKETGKTGADAWIGFGSIHLVWELGKQVQFGILDPFEF